MNQIWIYAACTLCIGVHAKALHLKLFFICRILVRLVWPCLWNEPFNSWSRFIWFLFYAWWLILFCLFSHSLILSFLIHPKKKKKKSVFLFFLSISSNSSLCVYELIYAILLYFFSWLIGMNVCVFFCVFHVSLIYYHELFHFFYPIPLPNTTWNFCWKPFLFNDTFCFLFPVVYAILADVGHLVCVCVYVVDLVLALLAFTFHLPLLLPSPHLSPWQLCFHHHL